MIKRGFVANWQNRRWVGKDTAFNSGQSNPDIIPGGTGSLPNFFILLVRGRGYGTYIEDDEEKRYLQEVCYASPVFTSENGQNFRFLVIYRRESHLSEQATCYFIVSPCMDNGKLMEEPGALTTWDSNVADSGNAANGSLLWSGAESTPFSTISTKNPTITTEVYNMMLDGAGELFVRANTGAVQGYNYLVLATVARRGTFWSSNPLYWPSDTPGVSQIVSRAQSLSGYKYWYGGAGQIASQSIANSLRAAYPSIWTADYYNKALNDIGKRVGDCSYLVNYAYSRASEGNHGPSTSQYLGMYAKWSGTPKNGMIAWRNGHAGIYNNGKVIQLVGIDYDYQEQTYVPSAWGAILYDPNITY